MIMQNVQLKLCLLLGINIGKGSFEVGDEGWGQGLLKGKGLSLWGQPPSALSNINFVIKIYQ